MPPKDKQKRKEYMRRYMPDYRKRERALIRLAKKNIDLKLWKLTEFED